MDTSASASKRMKRAEAGEAESVSKSEAETEAETEAVTNTTAAGKHAKTARGSTHGARHTKTNRPRRRTRAAAASAVSLSGDDEQGDSSYEEEEQNDEDDDDDDDEDDEDDDDGGTTEKEDAPKPEPFAGVARQRYSLAGGTRDGQRRLVPASCQENISHGEANTTAEVAANTVAAEERKKRNSTAALQWSRLLMMRQQKVRDGDEAAREQGCTPAPVGGVTVTGPCDDDDAAAETEEAAAERKKRNTVAAQQWSRLLVMSNQAQAGGEVAQTGHAAAVKLTTAPHSAGDGGGGGAGGAGGVDASSFVGESAIAVPALTSEPALSSGGVEIAQGVATRPVASGTSGAIFGFRKNKDRKRPKLEATASRFVSCPCCGRSVAMALLDDHLDMCGRAPEEPSADPAANGGSTCEAQGATVGQLPPVPAPAAPATPASSVWGGLRVAQTQSQLSSAAAAAETSQQAALLPQTQATCCPACGKQMLFAFLNAHLDSGECDGGRSPRALAEEKGKAFHDVRNSSPSAGAGAGACVTAVDMPSAGMAAQQEQEQEVLKAWEKRWDDLGRELACPICLCMFSDPATLPCQHSFCYDCAIAALRASRDSVCPLCKLPTFPRDIRPNPHLRSLAELLEKPMPSLPAAQ